MKILRKKNSLYVLMQLSRLAIGGLEVLQDRQEKQVRRGIQGEHSGDNTSDIKVRLVSNKY